jgi:hypothetical protein
MLQNRMAAAQRPLTSRSRTTNKPLRRANGNTACGRRVRDLYRAFLQHMGNPSDPISQANALHAAELAVAVEQARLAAARGEACDVDALVRLSNLADRAVKRLGIDRNDKRKPEAGPSLQSYLAELAQRPSAVADDGDESSSETSPSAEPEPPVSASSPGDARIRRAGKRISGHL